jgi:hypothetical protein
MMSMFSPCSAAAKLRHAITAQRALVGDPKHAVLVAVKSHRLAPSFKINPDGMKIGKAIAVKAAQTRRRWSELGEWFAVSR